ncbi:MAG: hypothetical protein PVI86_12910 [Phycisphaerae bacterium]
MICDQTAQIVVAGTHVGYRIGEFDVSVSSEIDTVLTDFAALYEGYPSGEGSEGRALSVGVRRVGNGAWRRERYEIVGDGEAIGHERRRAEVIPFLEWGINWCLISTRAEFLQLHAATMARDGIGVVLAAGSGGGKSTLVAGLVARGWTYLSDEFALLCPETLDAHAFPKAICIKAGAFGIVRELGLRFVGKRYYVKGLKGRVGYVNPREVDPHRIGDRTRIRLVLFPKYTPGRKPTVSRISRASAAFALASSALNRNAFRDQGVSVLSRVVRSAECFSIDSGSLEGACDRIDSLVDGL